MEDVYGNCPEYENDGYSLRMVNPPWRKRCKENVWQPR